MTIAQSCTADMRAEQVEDNIRSGRFTVVSSCGVNSGMNLQTITVEDVIVLDEKTQTFFSSYLTALLEKKFPSAAIPSIELSEDARLGSLMIEMNNILAKESRTALYGRLGTFMRKLPVRTLSMLAMTPSVYPMTDEFIGEVHAIMRNRL